VLTGVTRFTYEAEGVVTRISDSEVELQGKYTYGSRDQRSVARPLTYNLTRRDDVLSGSFVGTSNMVVPVTLLKR